jgi:hypothetical protein
MHRWHGTLIAGLMAIAAVSSAETLRLATRDDVDDSKYLHLSDPYDAVGRVIIGNRSCTATLVVSTDGTRKVLTSAHCVDWNSDNEPEVPPSSITFKTGNNLEGPSAVAVDIKLSRWSGKGARDLAVFTLDEFDGGAGPIPLPVSNAQPVGEEVVMVGYGTRGTGLPPFENILDNLRRAATNAADEFFAAGEHAGEIRTDFDHPRDPAFSTMGEATPSLFEGTSGVGDSGGPMIFEDSVIGVLHGGENPTEFGFSEYGDVSIFAGLFYGTNVTFLRASNVLVVGSGDATNVATVDSVAGSGQPFVATADGSPAREGGVVRVGTFPEGFDPTVEDFDSIARNWMPFGEASIRTLADEAGRFSGSNAADNTDFSGAKIYWWILDTITDTPTLDLGNVKAWGLFSSSNVSWTFPAIGVPPPANGRLLSSTDVNQAFGGLIEAERLVLVPIPGFVVSYELWAQDAFPEETPSEERTREADPDGDQLSNGMEWVLAASPLLHDSSPLRVENTEGTIAVHFVRRRGIRAGTLRAEFSRNLIRWDDAFQLADSTLTQALSQEMEKVELRFNQNLKAGFWRLVYAGE